MEKLCECGCGKLVRRRFVRGHNPTRGCLGMKLSLAHRLNISKANGGNPTLSPVLPGVLVWRRDKPSPRWWASSQGRQTLHAKMVWESYNGSVPEGFRVHHKNGDPSLLENDNPENLMLLTSEWNLNFMPQLARGFGVSEDRVTKAYLRAESLPYEKRFPEVCRILLAEMS